MDTHDAHDDFLGPGEAGRLLGVSPKTVARWASQGLIPAIVTLGGHRRFRRTDIEAAQGKMQDPDADRGEAAG